MILKNLFVCFLSLIVILPINGLNTYEQFNTAYIDSLSRLNELQYKAAIWIYDNLKDDAVVLYIATPTFIQRAWMQSISSRLGVFDQYNLFPIDDKNIVNTDYILVDFSYYNQTNNIDAVNDLRLFEEYISNSTILVYDNVVRIYKYNENR